MTENLPLAGLKVYDASQGVAGPYCSLLLALNGAEVTKVEPPEGDWLRHLGKPVDGHSPHSWYLNRGKRGVVIDTRTSQGRAQALEMANECDVFIASFRPGVVDRLGLSYEALSKSRPDIVHCLISGFGQQGPLAQRPAVDGVLQAFTGWTSINQDAAGAPRTFPFYAVDMLAGMYAFQAVQSALIKRFRFGGGAKLEVSLMEAAAAFLGPRLLEQALATGAAPQLFSSPNGPFRASDGWFMVAVTTQAQFELVCDALERPDLAKDERFASRPLRITNAATLDALLSEEFAKRDCAACDAAFERTGAMGTPVLGLDGLLAHPQMRAAGALLDGVTQGGASVPLAGIPGVDKGMQLRQPPPLAPKP